MILYCCRKKWSDGKVVLLEIEVTEKPKTFIVNNDKQKEKDILRSVIRKNELGILTDYGECFGTTKVQALAGFVSAKSKELAGLEKQCDELREVIAQANALNK